APDASGEIYNINADTAAGALASAIGAERLVMLTNVEGLYTDWLRCEGAATRVGASSGRSPHSVSSGVGWSPAVACVGNETARRKLSLLWGRVGYCGAHWSAGGGSPASPHPEPD
ncbi:amino acid kinase family protein, partial [Corynebacterium bovis]|uniref:amino acid kinase family protein n=1 Tax=Corynebacterium bovis TaxID=36808 RepID=UPI0040633A95